MTENTNGFSAEFGWATVHLDEPGALKTVSKMTVLDSFCDCFAALPPIYTNFGWAWSVLKP